MTSKETPRKKLKLLCMHGYGTNAEFMKMQTEILRRDVENLAQFIFVNGPEQIPIAMVGDPKVVKNLKGPPYAWYSSARLHKTTKMEDEIKVVNKMRTILQQASDYYDGALCFSQGSMAFQKLLWYQAKGLIDWPIIRNIKFFINFSADGFRLDMKSLGYKRLSIPNLHFFSVEDFLFNRLIICPTLFENPEIIYHSFGHRFPVLGVTEKEQLRAFLKKYGYGDKKLGGIESESRL